MGEKNGRFIWWFIEYGVVDFDYRRGWVLQLSLFIRHEGFR
jgi:hypothetical protein